jgi:ribonuclease HII
METPTAPSGAALTTFAAGPVARPPRVVLRNRESTWALQSALHRCGLGPVAGVDEAGRGPSAGPLVVAACVLRPGDAGHFDGLNDSKLLTAAARDRWFDVVRRRAVTYSVVVIPAAEVDALGVHVANIEGMRRAVAGLSSHPGYVLTDGFRVPGLTAPTVAVVGGDRSAACVAAASVLAKVTRDRIMVAVHERYPVYGFDEHKGYCTPAHTAALAEHGPCPEHRFSFVNVVAAAAAHGMGVPRPVARPVHQARVCDRVSPRDSRAGDGMEQNELFSPAAVAGSERGGARLR